jgi:nucleotide-binding universal stress UspA family protein
MLETIIVPLDGSILAEAVLAQVRKILFRKDAELVLVRAMSIPAGTEVTTPELIDSLQVQSTWYLEELARRLQQQGARVRSVLRAGDPARVILDVASEMNADLIAMSTHGRTGLSRWAFGSVAEKVLRASRVPVLAMRSFRVSGDPMPSEELSLKRILVPVADEDLSLEIVESTIAVARLFGSSITLLHACDGPSCAIPVPQMKSAYDQFRKAGLDAEPLMREGDPVSRVLEACRDVNADLIAMATHGRSGLSRWVMGSVTEKILRASPVPMLIVRPAHADASSQSRQAPKSRTA